MPHRLDELLANLPVEAPAHDRLTTIWQYYEAETQTALSQVPTEAERRAVYEWLAPQLVHSQLTLMTRRMRLHSEASLSMTRKAGWLRSALCPVCDLSADSTPRDFSVDVNPWSAQSKPKDEARRNAILKEKISEELARRQTFFGVPKAVPLCITTVAVLPHRANSIDADNLVKGLLDSFSSIVYEDDRHIQCLTSRRITYAGDTGYYLVHIREVEPWSVDVVWDNPSKPHMASGRRIDP